MKAAFLGSFHPSYLLSILKLSKHLKKFRFYNSLIKSNALMKWRCYKIAYYFSLFFAFFFILLYFLLNADTSTFLCL